MSIGSVQANFARLSFETTDTFQQLRCEAAEAKLYYLRDVHSLEEFDALVDEEFYRAATNVMKAELSVKEVARSIKKKICIFLKRRAT
jgi:hypothetical protein